MVDPIGVGAAQRAGAPQTPQVGQTGAAGADQFADALRQQLEQVSQMQEEANSQVQRLLTGELQSPSEVFTAARKAEVAFSLLMEVRNKMVDAYNQLREVRV